jgi:hypothetical protein
VVAKLTQSGGPELAELWRRVDALDAEVAKLKRLVRANGSRPSEPWWRELAGKYEGDPVFEGIVKEGQKWRAAQRRKAGGRRARS